MNRQAGFAIIEGLIIIVVIVALAGGSYTVWHRQHSTATSATNTKLSYSSPPVTTLSAPQVTNASNLNTALETLNQTDVNASTTDSTQLNSQAASF